MNAGSQASRAVGLWPVMSLAEPVFSREMGTVQTCLARALGLLPVQGTVPSMPASLLPIGQESGNHRSRLVSSQLSFVDPMLGLSGEEFPEPPSPDFRSSSQRGTVCVLGDVSPPRQCLGKATKADGDGGEGFGGGWHSRGLWGEDGVYRGAFQPCVLGVWEEEGPGMAGTEQ